MKTLIACGHICLDITPLFPADIPARPLSETLIPGNLIRMDGAAVNLGGSAANTGLAMLRLGAAVRLIGKIGRDDFGKLVRRRVREAGADDRYLIETEESGTGYTVVIAAPGNDRLFLHAPGANDTFRAADVPEDSLAGAALFHYGYPPVMRCMWENDGAELKELYRRVRMRGVATGLDLCAVDADSPAGKADWAGILAETLPLVDFFVPSFEELLFMLDRPAYEARRREAEISLEGDALPLARKALSMGCAAVLLKCGEAGMVLVTARKERLDQIGTHLELDTESWKEKTLLQPCIPAPGFRSATGAGDASIAAFLCAAAEGMKPEKCVRLAAAQGAMAVTAWDALSGLKTFPELEEYIRTAAGQRGSTAL